MAKQLAYDQWIERLDAAIGRELGVSWQDLPDVDYYGMFNAGVAPERAAAAAIRKARAA